MKKLHHAPTPTTTTVAGATVSAKSRSSQSSTTSLQMAPVGIAAFAGAMSGGLFAGSLHAIAGTLPFTLTIDFTLRFYVSCVPKNLTGSVTRLFRTEFPGFRGCSLMSKVKSIVYLLPTTR